MSGRASVEVAEVSAVSADTTVNTFVLAEPRRGRRRGGNRGGGQAAPPASATVAAVLALQALLSKGMDSTAHTVRLAVLLCVLGALAIGALWMWR